MEFTLERFRKEVLGPQIQTCVSGRVTTGLLKLSNHDIQSVSMLLKKYCHYWRELARWDDVDRGHFRGLICTCFRCEDAYTVKKLLPLSSLITPLPSLLGDSCLHVVALTSRCTYKCNFTLLSAMGVTANQKSPE